VNWVANLDELKRWISAASERVTQMFRGGSGPKLIVGYFDQTELPFQFKN
jgi:hypothetical protein